MQRHSSASPIGTEHSETPPLKVLLAGLMFQQELERLAFAHGSAPSIAPAQRLRDFVEGRKSTLGANKVLSDRCAKEEVS